MATKLTKQQEARLASITERFGGTYKILDQYYNGKIWVEWHNPDKKWYDHQRMAGTIGVRGAIHLHLFRLVSSPVLRTDVDLKVYLGETAAEKRSREALTDYLRKDHNDGN